jgi:ATP-dependent DNA helicase RecG
MDKIKLIINAMQQDPRISAAKIAMQLGVSSRSIEKRIRTMRENGIICRIGPDKGGFWQVNDK